MLRATQLTITILFCWIMLEAQAPQTTAAQDIRVTSAGPSGTSVRSIVIDPLKSDKIYATTSAGAFKTTNGGESWKVLNFGQPKTLQFFFIQRIKIDPSDSDTLYAEYSSLDDRHVHREGLLKSTNGGESWSDADLKTYDLTYDPSKPKTVYARNSGKILKSADGGKTWNTFDIDLPKGVSGLSHFVISPSVPQTLYALAGNDGDFHNVDWVFKSTDGGLTWRKASSGLPNDYIQTLAVDPLDSGVLYAGMSHGILKTMNGGEDWTASNKGLPDKVVYALVIDPSNAGAVYAGTYGAGIFKSTNTAESWTEANTGLTEKNIFALVIDPSNHSKLYAGTIKGVFKSINAGASWQPTGLQ